MRWAFPRKMVYAGPSMLVAYVLAGQVPGVTFATPEGTALFGLLLPLVLLHMFTATGRPRVVANLALYLGPETPRHRRRFRIWPFWRQPEFWLRASLINVLGLTAMTPVWEAERPTPLILVLDRSESLARPGKGKGTSGDALMRKEASALVSAWRGPVALLAGGGDRQRRRALGATKRTLLNDIGFLEAPVGWGELPALLEEAERVRVAAGMDAVVALFSDNLDGSADRALRESSLWPSCKRGRCRHVVIDAGPEPWVSPQPLSPLVSIQDRLAVRVRVSEPGKLSPGAGVLATLRGSAHGPSQQTQFGRLDSDSVARLTLPYEGCWALRVRVDETDEGAPAFVLATAATTGFCLVRRDPGAEDELTELARGVHPQLVTLPYEQGTIEEANCRVLAFVDPPDDRLINSELAHRADVLVVHRGQPASGAVCHVENALDGALRQLEPRLLQLAPIPTWSQRPGARALISLTGPRPDAFLTAASLMDADDRAELQIAIARDLNRNGTTQALVKIALRWIAKARRSVAVQQVATGSEPPPRAIHICGEDREDRRVTTGIWAQRDRGDLVTKWMSATSTDPNLRTLASMPTVTPSGEETGALSGTFLLWPFACCFGMALLFEEQRGRT